MFTLLKNLAFLTALLVIGAAFARSAFDRQGRIDAPVRLAAAPVAVAVIGFLSPNIYIFCGVAALIPFIVARTKAEVAATLIVLLVAVPIIDFTVSTGGAVLLKTQTTSFVSLACLVAMMAKPGQTSRGWRLTDFVFLPLSITLVWMASRGYSTATFFREAIDHALFALLPGYVLLRAVRTRDDLRKVMTALLMVVLMLSVVALYEGVRTWPLYQSLSHGLDPRENIMSLTRNVRAGLMRAPGPFSESTKFGYWLAIGLLLALTSPVFRDRARRNWAVVLIALAMFMTQSRGSWLGGAVGITALLYHQRKTAAALSAVIGAVIGYGVLSLVAGNEGRLAEMLGKAGAAAGTFDYRQQLWVRSLEQFRLSPLSGIDLPTVYRVMDDMRQGQGIIDFVNTYAWFGVVGGSIGVAMFLLVCGLALLRTFPRRPAARRAGEADWNDFVFAAFVACMAMLSGTSFYQATLLWFFQLLAIGAIAARVRSREPARARPARSEAPSALPSGMAHG